MWILDFETRSGTDIARGHDQYFQDPDADILCLVYGDWNDASPRSWWPGCGYEPADLFDYVLSGGLVGASNAAFDRSAWEYLCVELYGFPEMKLEQWYCTQAQSRVAGLPSKLEESARALRTKSQKSRRGAELIKLMSIPPFEHTPKLLAEMVKYCRQDWLTMRDVMRATPLLTERLHEDYVTNEIVNERGVRVDLELARAAAQYAEEEREEIAADLIKVTAGAVEKPTQHQRFKRWLFLGLYALGAADAVRLMIRYKKGEKKLSSDKTVRGNMLADPVALGIPPQIVKALQLMDDASGAATSKYAKMCLLASDGDRVRGVLRAFGASSTLRYSSLGLQLHNFRRDAFELHDVDHYRDQVIAGNVLTDPKTDEPVRVIDTLGKLLRAALIPADGKVFVVGDWSAVESVFTAWLCRETRKTAVFARGEDPYCYAAEGVYGRKITKEDDPKEREVGKVVDLACGFLGGEGALASMASTRKIHIPENQRKSIVEAWRNQHPKTVKFGNRLFQTALSALRDVGVWKECDRVAYLFDGDALYARLPDGKTLLRYPEARVEYVVPPWNKDKDGKTKDPSKPLVPNITALKAAFTMAADADEWPRHALWRGLLLENCCARGTLVATDRGWVKIEEIHSRHRIWDGEEFVDHGGLAGRGVQSIIQVWGLALTPDHEVLADGEQWIQASEAQRGAHDREEVRLPHSLRSAKIEVEDMALARPLRLRGRKNPRGARSTKRFCEILRLQKRTTPNRDGKHPRNERASGLLGVAGNARSVPIAISSSVEKLRRAGNSSLRSMGRDVRKLLGRHGLELSTRPHIGSAGQLEGLQHRKLHMGRSENSSQKQKKFGNDRDAMGPDERVRSFRTQRDWAHNHPLSNRSRMERSRCGNDPTRAEVYDILNCGPRRRFVVKGSDGPVIVHNCVQASCAILLRDLVHLFRDLCIFHVHDEIILEIARELAEALVIELRREMETPPAWCADLLLSAQPVVMEVYGK